MLINSVKKALKAGQPSVGTWLTLGSITASRFLARIGFHWLTVDIEHSLVDWETATHMFASIADAGCIALARVPANRHDHIKRVLDNGAMGIVVPMVNSRQEAEDAIAAALYPPAGNRSVGGAVHALNFQTTGPDYFAHANERTVARPPMRAYPGGRECRRHFLRPRHRRHLRRPQRSRRLHA